MDSSSQSTVHYINMRWHVDAGQLTDERNDTRRLKDLAGLPDVALLAYHERVTTNILATPEHERAAMELFDGKELAAAEAEMGKRGLHAKATRELASCWRLPRMNTGSET
jgi:hypothetical protein